MQQPPIPYRLLKSKDFDFRTCKKIILEKLKVTSMRRKEASGGTEGEGGGRPNYHPDSDRSFPQVFSGGDLTYGPSTFHHLAAVIDFESKVLVKALGALLSYLQSTVFQLTEGKYVIVNRIADAKSSAHMVISPSTFSALHIFSTENHPLIAKGRGNSKEGFSLFSLLDRTRSKCFFNCEGDHGLSTCCAMMIKCFASHLSNEKLNLSKHSLILLFRRIQRSRWPTIATRVDA